MHKDSMFRRIVKVTLLMAALLAPVIVVNLYFILKKQDSSPNPVNEILGDTESAGFEQVLQPRVFQFPADHGPHLEYQTEWWYLTGNLTDEKGRRFGYQLTFFRFALAPEGKQRESSWAMRDAYMAHFAITDVGSQRFYSKERYSRGAAGLAGAEITKPGLRVWLNDWSIEEEGNIIPACDGCLNLKLRANEDDYKLSLNLISVKPIVLQGEKGLSRKNAKPGNASYYYSLPRLVSVGEINIGESKYKVNGMSWLDREWSTSSLAEEQQGWDWFSLHLPDGRDLMLYQLRLRDGEIDPFSAGSLIDADGKATTLNMAHVQLDVLSNWRSPNTEVQYPAKWRLTIPSESIDLTITPVLENQEIDHSFRYWEGAVDVESANIPTKGYGYVELVGYG